MSPDITKKTVITNDMLFFQGTSDITNSFSQSLGTTIKTEKYKTMFSLDLNYDVCPS